MISFALANAITFLQFGASIVIARLLSPKEIGIYSIAAAIVGIAQLFRNVGVANYLVQEKNLTHDKLRSAFGIQLVMSWFLGLLLFLSSGLVATLYNEEGVHQVMIVSSATFLLAPFGGVNLTLLARDMKFRERSVVEIVSSITHACISITMAYLGFGYMSLAWASLGNTLATVVVSSFFRRRGLPWLPGFREVRSVLSFSMPTAGADIVRYLRTNTPELVAGRVISFEAVAFLSRASGLIRIFESVVGSAINRVAFAYFPQEHRLGSNLKTLYIKANSYLCVVAWPFFATLAVLAKPVVELLYGNQWTDSIPLVQILAVAAALAAPFSLTNTTLNAIGAVKTIFGFEAMLFVLSAGMLLIAANFGITAVAAVLVLISACSSALCARYLRKLLAVGFHDIFRSSAAAIPATLASLAIPIWVMYFSNIEQTWITLAVSGFGAVAGWLLSILIGRHPFSLEIIGAAKRVWNR
ncbi:lipopolysaccharide biosynthesis protein [Propionivibrio sp.]|uniref:lipopolysaccharide biosynthesis protein n=1 Tax=Propionivibrio sp. TaxID=2212460 RepID=UPI0025F02645|nr:lipopolysaccharide biosynthesis protein [Propionivibrio sp.]MBK8744993.1 lipopolysaccharide biosynthesis protein [Propionivibrio sp.]